MRGKSSSKARVAAIAAAALIVAAVGTWYLASPGWTLHQMKAAADANDPEALNPYIDYPSLRQDLKAEIEAQMVADDRLGFSPLNVMIGRAMISRVIDGVVTPAGIRAVLTAKRDQRLTGAALLIAPVVHVPDDPMIKRRGFSEFLVVSKQRPTSGLVFKRHGLSWKLSGVRGRGRDPPRRGDRIRLASEQVIATAPLN